MIFENVSYFKNEPGSDVAVVTGVVWKAKQFRSVKEHAN